MRIIHAMLALVCLALAGCSGGGTSGGQNANEGGGGVGGNASNLTAMVIQECKQMSENRDFIPINGSAFGPGANDPNNQTFTNNCL